MFFLVVFLAAQANSEVVPFGPWSVSGRAPVVNPADVPASGIEAEGSLGRDYSEMFLRFYQNVLSVVTVSHCPMLPSCSNYSLDAVRRHGALVGILLTADRLLHEGDEQRYAEVRMQEGEPRYVDPVENNDFWWHEE